ncbi:hypothetical protein A2U01_0000778, partial [Trifolium medium]|nr:hypothetical protein [Trifolium medium]
GGSSENGTGLSYFRGVLLRIPAFRLLSLCHGVNSLLRVLWHLLAPAKSASIVTTSSFALWKFILRCTVDGTASNDAKVGLPRMQL